jgi:uncharacterized membrane protein YkgB
MSDISYGISALVHVALLIAAIIILYRKCGHLKGGIVMIYSILCVSFPVLGPIIVLSLLHTNTGFRDGTYQSTTN